MAYQDSIKETEHAKISLHNKAELAPEHAWIVSGKREKDTLSFFKDATLSAIKDVFTAVAGLKDDGAGKFVLFHAVRPEDRIQNTNSKLPNLHIHAFTGPFAKEFAHIADPSVKSYVVQPNIFLAETIKTAAHAQPGQSGFNVITLPKNEGGETESHTILVHAGFSGFDAFTRTATDADWEEFRAGMIQLIEPWIQEGKGGARVIIDDRYTKTGFVTVQILAGENMDRSGQNKQRYFERPATLG